MRVLNIHQRELAASPAQVGELIDSLAGPRDSLWPRHSWPRMQFDRPLAEGAVGGHGPIRYFVEQYVPGTSIRFRFTGPRGFDGYHGFDCQPTSRRTVVLKHTLQMTAHGPAIVTWPLLYRPLHDALIEDSLATAQAALGLEPDVRPWSTWVRLLRWALTGRGARPQTIVSPQVPRGVSP
ncbi:MAG: hypothetical protein AB7O59_06930 [Pirellulales bacterium]